MLWTDFLAQQRRDLEEPLEGVWYDTSLLAHANDAALDIAMRTKCSRDWQYTQTVASQYIYDLPDYSLEVIEMYWDGNQLVRQDFGDWLTLPEDEGEPRYYAIDDSNVYLKPIPDSAAELSYLRFTVPVPLTSTDSMPFEDRYNLAIGYFVKARAYEQIGDVTLADLMLGRYENELAKITAQEISERNAGRSVAPREVW